MDPQSKKIIKQKSCPIKIRILQKNNEFTLGTMKKKENIENGILIYIIQQILGEENEAVEFLDKFPVQSLSEYLTSIDEAKIKKSGRDMLHLLIFLNQYEQDLLKLHNLLQYFIKKGIVSQELLFEKSDCTELQQQQVQDELVQAIRSQQKEKYQSILQESKVIKIQNGLELRLYPLYKKQQIDNLYEFKTIIVIGQTGSGKTTMINFFLNYYLGIAFEDNIRFILIQEEIIAGSQATSQTQDVNIYYIKPINGSLGLRIIDTPGFGDTRGLEQDKIIANKIQKCFKEEVETVTAICFIVQASNVRLTANQNYILSCITQMFGKDIIENFVFMFTFCDGGNPQAKEALLFKGDCNHMGSHVAELISKIKEPWFLKLNSSAFLDENTGAEQQYSLTKLFWKIAMASFEVLVEKKLKVMKDSSLILTREVIKERESLITVIQNLKPKIQQSLSLIENYKSTYSTINLMESQMQDCSQFKIPTKRLKFTRIPLLKCQYVTNCVICNQTCHFPCSIPENKDKKRCAAMDNTGTCKICERKCLWSSHQNMDFRFESIEYTEEIELQELKQKYFQSQSTKSEKEQILEGIEKQYLQYYTDCFVMEQELMMCINNLNKIALQPAVCKSEEEYITIMIQEEFNSKKEGYLKRIQTLEEQKSNLKLIKETIGNTGDTLTNKSLFDKICSLQKVGLKYFFSKIGASK